MILPRGRGKDCLVIAQTGPQSTEHLYTLKRLIMDSPKYRKYLITRSSELFFKEEQTKMGTLFLKNPDNPFRPMRIIGLGFTASAIWSWKNVYRIHMSDPAAANVKDDSGVYASAFSRLANTNGRMMIEGPPRGPQGRFYELHEQFKDNENPDFKVFLIQIYEAEKAGLVTHDFIEKQRLELGSLFAQTYEGSFIAGVGNLFYPEDVDRCIKLGEENKTLDINPNAFHMVGVDPGFASSRAAVYVGEYEKQGQYGIIRIVSGHEYDKTTPSYLANVLFDLYRHHTYMRIFIDGSNRAFLNEAKIRFGENLNWTKESDVNPQSNIIIPVNFGTMHKQMLQKLQLFVTQGMIAIPKAYDKLLISMRTAQHNNYDLDKTQTANNDALDALRLLCMGVYYKGQ